MTEQSAIIGHLKGCRLIYVSFWNNTVALGWGEAHGAHGDHGKLSTLSERGINEWLASSNNQFQEEFLKWCCKQMSGLDQFSNELELYD